MNIPVSIFNDVLGPIMRGPSSSHTAASVRIGKFASQLLGKDLKEVNVEFSKNGSLASTYSGQGSDIGLACGLLGFDLHSPQLINSLTIAKQKNISINFVISDSNENHPNTYKLTLYSNDGDSVQVKALSTGGGMIKVIEIDEIPVEIYGDYYELFIFINNDELQRVKNNFTLLKRKLVKLDFEEIFLNEGDKNSIINIKFSRPIEKELIESILVHFKSKKYLYSEPVLSILSRKNINIPFSSASEMLKHITNKKEQLWEIALKYESERGNISKEEVWNFAKDVYEVMRESVSTGLSGTFYKDRILGWQSRLMDQSISSRKIIDAPIVNNISKYTMAVMESKSSYNLIVAAPTAGSSGVLPGAILGCADTYGYNDDECIKAILAAGLIGVFIAQRSTFAAELAGCQAECGAGSGMAAAGIVQLVGGKAFDAINAASFALQNIIGLICDPVANRVEVPCLGRNVLGAMNAFTSANLILAGIDAVIPLDEVIESIDSVGKLLPSEVRCTGYGGLSITATSRKIEEKLKENKL